MKHRNTFLVSIFSLILGCMLSMSFTGNEICEFSNESPIDRHFDLNQNVKSFQFVVLIFSNPLYFEKRSAIRNTWLKLMHTNENEKNDLSPEYKEWSHYFVVGRSSVPKKIRSQLITEQKEYGDLLILPELKDQYNTLSEKLLQSIKWVYENNPNLYYLIKCDDDSFVRIDLIIQELKSIREKILKSSKSSVMYSASGGRFKKEQSLTTTGLYWGYFKGNAHVKLKGKWAENDFFLCDRYLPYALGGGYILSADVVQFIAKNSQFLQLYNAEDVSVGVWTASLSRLYRLHDTRFDTEWSTRGCNDSHLIRHKQSPDEMIEMYTMLKESKNKKLCKVPSVLRTSYEYNWTVSPSQCCKSV